MVSPCYIYKGFSNAHVSACQPVTLLRGEIQSNMSTSVFARLSVITTIRLRGSRKDTQMGVAWPNSKNELRLSRTTCVTSNILVSLIRLSLGFVNPQQKRGLVVTHCHHSILCRRSREAVMAAGDSGISWTKRLLNTCMRKGKVPGEWRTGLIVQKEGRCARPWEIQKYHISKTHHKAARDDPVWKNPK